MGYPFDNAAFQWETGWHRLQALDADPATRRPAERAVEAIGDELRRRIGTTFTSDELAELYGRGTDWGRRAAMEAAPGIVADAQALTDAAFWLHLRGAGDFAGGRRLAV